MNIENLLSVQDWDLSQPSAIHDLLNCKPKRLLQTKELLLRQGEIEFHLDFKTNRLLQTQELLLRQR